MANADGTGIRPLTATGGVQEEMPSWSPDARQIAYFRARPGDPDGVGEIWVMNADGTSPRKVALGWHPHWSTVQGSPGQPRLVLHIQKLDRHRSCLGQYDGLVASVKTRSSKQTRFDFALYVDGRQVDHVFATRSLGLGVDLLQLRRGPHRMRAVMTDPAVHDTAIRTATFRKC